MSTIKVLALGLGLVLIAGCGSGDVDHPGYTNEGHGINWRTAGEIEKCNNNSCQDIELIIDGRCDKLSITVTALDYSGGLIGMGINYTGGFEKGVAKTVTVTSVAGASTLVLSGFECGRL